MPHIDAAPLGRRPVPRLSRRYLLGAVLVGTVGRASAQDLHEITIGLASNSFATAPARLAQSLGSLRAQGIEPRFVVLDSASAATTALISRSVNFALSGPGELVLAQTRGQKVVSVADIYAGLSGTLVLSRAVVGKLAVKPDAPVSERLRAIDGLTIAAPSATGAYTVAVRGAARAVGATPRFTYMSLAAMPAALESGAVAGFVSGAPFWSAPVTRGSGVVWLSGPRGDFPLTSSPANSANLQAMRDWADAHKDIVRNTVAAFQDFATAVKTRPGEVEAALARLYPDLDETSLKLLFSAESRSWAAAGAPTLEGMERDIAFTRSAGLPIPEAVGARAMIYP